MRLSASVGLARFPDDGRDSRTLVMNADLALGRAKERGGRSVEVYTPSMNKPALERMRLERQLHQAIDRHELEAFFQPQIDLSTGQIGAFEVLARWRHPDRGYVSPGEFIPVAEESGLIVPIGERMLEAACRQGRLWHERGWRVRLAVNLSVVQLRQKDLADKFAAVLSRYGFRPGLHRAGDHRGAGAGARRGLALVAWPGCASWACSWPSTTSAPATRRWLTSPGCRWTR